MAIFFTLFLGVVTFCTLFVIQIHNLRIDYLLSNFNLVNNVVINCTLESKSLANSFNPFNSLWSCLNYISITLLDEFDSSHNLGLVLISLSHQFKCFYCQFSLENIHRYVGPFNFSLKLHMPTFAYN